MSNDYGVEEEFDISESDKEQYGDSCVLNKYLGIDSAAVRVDRPDLTQVENNTKGSTEATLKAIIKLLQSSSRKKREVQRKQNIVSQWQNITALYDRLLLLAFLIGIGAVSIWFMTLSPN